MAALALEEEYWRLLGATPPEERERITALNRLYGSRLEALLDGAAHRPPGELLVGAYPTHAFHAVATRTGSGSIVLVHDGLVPIAAGIASVLAALLPAESGGEPQVAEISEADANRVIRELIAAVTGRSPLESQFRPREPRFSFASFLTGSLVDFVIAHEAGHVLLGHLSGSSRAAEAVSGVRVPVSIPSWQEEMSADGAGMELLQAALGDSVGLESMFLGPVLFFEIVESASKALAPPADPERLGIGDVAGLATHPPAAARRSALIGDFHPGGPLARVPLLDWLVERMRAAR